MENCRDLIKEALNVLESCELSNYGRDWLWPATAHETAMIEVRSTANKLRDYLSRPSSEEP